MLAAVLIAYVDESGDTGDLASKGGASLTYTLGCVLVEASDWPVAFDRLLGLRRNLRETYGLQMRAEVKANYLIRGNGDLRGLDLAPAQRRLIFRAHLRTLATLPSRAFAVVVDKQNPKHTDPFNTAWETLMQRLERTSTSEEKPIMIVHDHGENDKVRAWVRRSRRHLTAGSLYGGYLKNSLPLLVDDAVPRDSKQSYFVQVADLVAYAAFRSIFAPSKGVAAVCPQPMWGELGAATHTAVSGVRPRAAPGIVYRQ